MTRTVIFAVAMSGGCATAAGQGELAVEIQTPVPMAYVSFVHARSSAFVEIGNIPEGTSSHLEHVRAGLWCLTSYTDSSGGFARVYEPLSPTCEYVEAAGRALLRLVRRGDALGVGIDNGALPGLIPRGPHLPSSAEVEQAVASVRPQLDACIADAQLPRGQRMAIHARVDGPSGGVSQAQVLPPHHVGTFTDCLTDVVETMVLAPSEQPDRDLVFAFP